MQKTSPITVVVSTVNFNCIDELSETIQSFQNSLKNYVLYFIVVDSFFDNLSRTNIRNFCSAKNIHLIESANLGYGHAHNLAFDYAKKNLDFDFYIVANPDIQVITIEKMFDYIHKNIIIAPQIKTLNGINQNPFLARRSPLILWFWKIKHLRRSLAFWIIASLTTKLLNRIARTNKQTKIYAPHGALIIVTKEAALRLNKFFDNKMFLFGEEFILAEIAYRLKIPVYYDSEIQFLHKRHISTEIIENKTQIKLGKESYEIFYNQYYKKK